MQMPTSPFLALLDWLLSGALAQATVWNTSLQAVSNEDRIGTECYKHFSRIRGLVVSYNTEVARAGGASCAIPAAQQVELPDSTIKNIPKLKCWTHCI